MSEPCWKLWIDTGGTFTDCVARDLSGDLHRLKVLSNGTLRGRIVRKINPHVYQFETQWDFDSRLLEGYRFQVRDSPEKSRLLAINYRDKTLVVEDNLPPFSDRDFEIGGEEEAPVLVARLLTATALTDAFPAMEIRLGTTRGTNALLERKGAKTLLVVTKGFGDLLRIGTQQRPDLFQLQVPEAQRLYHSVMEVEERLDATGAILQPLNLISLAKITGNGVESVGISLLHSYRNPEHEVQAGKFFRERGQQFVALSSELSGAVHYLRRTQTTMVHSYLAPVLSTYLRGIQQAIGQQDLKIMTSSGGLVAAKHFLAKDSLLSGPAGGVVATTVLGKRFGATKLISFDMGGTSTDVARIEGRADLRFTTIVDGIELHNATLAIETVAAGGGSVCFFDGYNLCVGPESAGAFPGPACYGAGGPLTITDVNLLLGKMDPGQFGIPIRMEAAGRALAVLRDEIYEKTGNSLTARQLLEGLEAIANEKMAGAIRRISVAHGIDPAAYTLMVYGGAGGLHGCQLAERLGILQVIIPYDAGLFSATGMGMARVSRMISRQVLQPWEVAGTRLAALLEGMQEEGREALRKEGIAGTETGFCSVFLRFAGQESTLEVPYTEGTVLETFEQLYRECFGYFPSDREIELESVRLEVIASSEPEPGYRIRYEGGVVAPVRNFTAKYAGEETVIPVFEWDRLQPGQVIRGGGILVNAGATVFLPAGWEGVVQESGDLIVFYRERGPALREDNPEAIELELFTNRFKAIAEEMGAQLQRTAFSVNVKERLDFSCALIDPEGELLVNAPHIPVHLGSLGICTRLVRDYLPLGPGDVVITNHPKYGGSHLPDVTLLAGVYAADNRLIGYVINRAHHAEIGGMTPGSMPPDAESLDQEGVVIVPQYLVHNGAVQWERLAELFTTGAFPTRSFAENQADITAALSALRKGQQQLEKLAAQHGVEKLFRYMRLLKDRAAAELQKALLPFEGKMLKSTEFLDDGHRINLRLTVTGGVMTIDFTGVSKRHPRNLNANLSIIYSAVLYVLRLLAQTNLPLNEGLLRQVRLVLPRDSFLNPDFRDEGALCPAVVGGNTEVSQRLVDTLLKAFGSIACSQGTMNNFLFGNERFGYYETIGGGTGAGEGFHGRSGVHQHMTNTRITDPEELERRYPIRLLEFKIRRGSGGKGKFNGGDGIVRSFEFLEPLSVTLLAQHRHFMPYGMAGGGGGQTGNHLLRRHTGEWIKLPGIARVSVEKYDRIIIETPGGGAYGETDEV